LGALGLSALDAIETAQPVAPELRKEQLAKIEESATSHAELFLVVAPAIRVLILAEPVAQE
jgi:hypothetical protein